MCRPGAPPAGAPPPAEPVHHVQQLPVQVVHQLHLVVRAVPVVLAVVVLVQTAEVFVGVQDVCAGEASAGSRQQAGEQDDRQTDRGELK